MASSTWQRKPRISKQQLADGMERAAAQQNVVLAALGMIARWSGMWKREAKRLRVENTRLAAMVSDQYPADRLQDRAENLALKQRVTDLECDLADTYGLPCDSPTVQLRVENEALLRRVSDLETELSQLYTLTDHAPLREGR